MGSGWHRGVAGISAGKAVETYPVKRMPMGILAIAAIARDQ